MTLAWAIHRSAIYASSVDVLKIDQTFIQEIQTDSDARAGVSLADAIIAMAKGLGLSVIAEGVERRAQLA